MSVCLLVVSCICVWRTCVCLCICIFIRIWIADIMGFQKIYGLRGPWGLTAVLQLICELRKNCCGTGGRIQMQSQRTLSRDATKVKESGVETIYREQKDYWKGAKVCSRSHPWLWLWKLQVWPLSTGTSMSWHTKKETVYHFCQESSKAPTT